MGQNTFLSFVMDKCVIVCLWSRERHNLLRAEMAVSIGTKFRKRLGCFSYNDQTK